MVRYVALQSILEEAGLAHDVHGEVLLGEADGSNSKFTTVSKPLTDANYDDVVTAEDVRVYVDGSPVDIEDVDPRFGTITLTGAPDEGSIVTVDYRYSAVSMDFLEEIRDEAQDVIDSRMTRVDSCAPYGKKGIKSVPRLVRGVCRRLGAGWLLIRDYGFNQDIEGTSKDGYKKLEEAKSALADYESNGGLCGDGEGGNSVGGLNRLEVKSDGDLFCRPDFNYGPRQSDKEW